MLGGIFILLNISVWKTKISICRIFWSLRAGTSRIGWGEDCENKTPFSELCSHWKRAYKYTFI